MMAIALVPFSIQGLAILLDEAVFHRRRGLPSWERIGHPIDTFLQLGCMLIPLFFAFNRANLILFSVAAFFSTLLITKDEHVHALHCEWRENWLHALLFIVHPVVLIATAYLWASPGEHGWFFPVLRLQILLMAGFGTYQIIYWGVWERVWRKNSK